MFTKTNIAEEYVKIVNENMFLREFTFTKNELKNKKKQKIELADNIVWIDDILFLIQIKWRDPKNVKTKEGEIKWFKNKVLKKAKIQIKSTLKYFQDFSTLEIENGRGFKVNLSNAPVSNAKKIIIYLPSNKLPEKEKFLKFYESQDVGLIHLFNFQDYRWICQYLITPCEIARFLDFREDMFGLFGEVLNFIPEQLVLGKFLSGDKITEINPKYIEYLTQFEENIGEFDISAMLKNFYSKTIKQNFQTNYIQIIREIAKLSRFELVEFKKRYLFSIERSKLKEYTTPYRITIPRTGIGFVFIPLPFKGKEFTNKWRLILENFILGHKYDQRLKKCIGVTIFRYENSTDIEIYWGFTEFIWEKDESMDKLLKENFPFRKVKERTSGGYKFKHE